MSFRFSRMILNLVLGLSLLCQSLVAGAQSTGLLYDPEPPADSAYVRVVHASRGEAVDISVDGRSRISKLGAGEASEYMVLTAGKHAIAVSSAGKPRVHASATIDVIRGRAMTVAFTALKADTAPVIFEDKANSNKLKALLAVYHLEAKAGPLDVVTADGNTKVFSGLAYGTSASLQVNPISIDLVVTAAGDKLPRGRVSLAMAQGGTYSIILLSGEGGKLVATALQNKIERYTGK
jgi:hypothetical protein